MREILFRGRKTDNNSWAVSNSWAVGSLIIASDYCCILESEDNVHPMDYPYLDNYIGTIDGKATPVIPETVGQYTGLTDSNGTMIFEGDIVKTVALSNDHHQKGATNYLLVHNFMGNTCLCRDEQLFTGLTLYPFGVDHEIEVIGNIHDNPEMINK